MLLNSQTHATAYQCKAESPYFEAQGMKRLSSLSLGVPNGDNGAICAWRSSSSDRLRGAPPSLVVHMTSAQFLDFLEPLPLVSVALMQLIQTSFELPLQMSCMCCPPPLARHSNNGRRMRNYHMLDWKEGRSGHQERALHVGQRVKRCC